jgi:hypothetical protein
MDDEEGCFALPGLAWSLLGYKIVKDEEPLGWYVYCHAFLFPSP